jgi:hypothetical protein
MAQTVLNFSIASTDERLTSRSGEIVFGEYLKAIGVDKLCDTYLPQPQSNRGYAPFNFIQPLVQKWASVPTNFMLEDRWG